MFGAERQKEEIETIREKKIIVKLSEADCERISKLCGEHNITVGELIENFIGDLVSGTYTNGSDERMLARNYFERCWFGMFPDLTLVNWLLNYSDMDLEEFYCTLDNIENNKEELEYAKSHADEFAQGEVETLKEDIAYWEKEIAEVKAEFLKENENANWEEEVANVKKFYEEMERMKDE